VGLGHLRGFDHVLARGVERAVRDVLLDAAVEEEGILTDVAQRLAEAAERDVFDVLSVDTDRPLVDIVHPQEEFEHRRFAGSRGTDQRERLAAVDGEVNILEDRLSVPESGRSSVDSPMGRSASRLP